MTTHLLDTNIVSYVMRARPAPVLHRLRDLGPGRVAISVVTAIELREGADLSKAAKRYHSIIDTILAEVPTLALPADAARVGGRLRATLRRLGRPLGDLDSLIAAHALALGIILVTNDAAFQRVEGLRVENWTES